ncbi:phage tail protein [Saccharopolyspora phatthalungensis]|uniref:Phage tail-like protein n=1 Tax=Saccharopolyspora phatthalungensis TaxID=664693 RepID=A0A840QAR1_9PSEU|nr:phage tail protein [Saccharopolyspora phatthalungensis]MBB5157037.1 phage tail-like protein [Saccharopolyspora phatthalungensis]
MAELGTQTYPFVGFRFEVRLDALPVGGFSECGGLRLRTEIQDFIEGGLNTHVHKLPVRVTQSDITLRRGVADRVLWDWYAELTAGTVRRRGGAILVRDASGSNVVAEWRFQRALPVTWIGPELDAAQSRVAVETIELAHEGLERRR